MKKISNLKTGRTRTLALVLSAVFIGGCATFSEDGGFGDVETMTRERLDKEVKWVKNEPAADAKAVSARLADGEVRKVDKETGKITIKHGPLVNLDMPAMTMVFRVKDPAMLDQLKAGDKISFEAAKVGGAYTVMKFETIGR